MTMFIVIPVRVNSSIFPLVNYYYIQNIQKFLLRRGELALWFPFFRQKSPGPYKQHKASLRRKHQKIVPAFWTQVRPCLTDDHSSVFPSPFVSCLSVWWLRGEIEPVNWPRPKLLPVYYSIDELSVVLTFLILSNIISKFFHLILNFLKGLPNLNKAAIN